MNSSATKGEVSRGGRFRVRRAEHDPERLRARSAHNFRLMGPDSGVYRDFIDGALEHEIPRFLQFEGAWRDIHCEAAQSEDDTRVMRSRPLPGPRVNVPFTPDDPEAASMSALAAKPIVG